MIKFIHSYPQFKYMENSCIIIIYPNIYGLITELHNDLFQVGMIAQLEEHCTGSNPRSGLNFSGLSRRCLSSDYKKKQNKTKINKVKHK